MGAHRAGVVITAKVSDGSDIEGVAHTATFNSEPKSVDGHRWFGFFLDSEAGTGTSPTLDVAFEYSPDGGTTWYSAPDGDNSATQAALAQVTDGGASQQYEFWQLSIPEGGDTRVRATFTIGGTSPSFTINQARWTLLDAPVN